MCVGNLLEGPGEEAPELKGVALIRCHTKSLNIDERAMSIRSLAHMAHMAHMVFQWQLAAPWQFASKRIYL